MQVSHFVARVTPEQYAILAGGSPCLWINVLFFLVCFSRDSTHDTCRKNLRGVLAVDVALHALYRKASLVKMGKGKLKCGEERDVAEIVSISIDPNQVSTEKIAEEPSRLSCLSAFSPGI